MQDRRDPSLTFRLGKSNDGFHRCYAAQKSVVPAEPAPACFKVGAGAQPDTQSDQTTRSKQEVMLAGLGPSLVCHSHSFDPPSAERGIARSPRLA